MKSVNRVAAMAIAPALLTIVMAAAPVRSVVKLAVNGRSNSNVSLATRGSFVAAVWSAALPTGVTDIFAALSQDGGRTFPTPVRVNSVAGQASVNGEQPPRVALVAPTSAAAPPELVIVWTAKGTQGTELLVARSHDNGRTFNPTTKVPNTDAPGNRGWENIAADARGQVHVVWLDHRELAKDGQMAMSHHDTGHTAAAADGVAKAQQSKLYYAALSAAPAVTSSAGAPRPLTGGVCYCCKTAITSLADGSVAVAWRHVYSGNLRDIAFTVSRDGGRTFASPVRVSQDQWQLEGCPDDGPAMAVDRTATVHIAWPTLVSGNGKDATIGIFYASSSDGKRFTERVKVPTEGTPHHPQIALRQDGSLAFAWDELIGGTRRVAFATGTIERPGRVTFARRVTGIPGPAIYPAIVTTADGVVAAWTNGPAESAQIVVERRP